MRDKTFFDSQIISHTNLHKVPESGQEADLLKTFLHTQAHEIEELIMKN